MTLIIEKDASFIMKGVDLKYIDPLENNQQKTSEYDQEMGRVDQWTVIVA